MILGAQFAHIIVVLVVLFETFHGSPITMRRKAQLPSFTNPDIKSVALQSPLHDDETTIPELVNKKCSAAAAAHTLLIFFTHLGDLSSFELAQKLNHYIPQIEQSKVNVLAVCPGATTASAQLFCEKTKFPIEKLYIDKDAKYYKQLGFARGFAPDTDISPYLKLLPMLAGIGSPGTIPEVLRGYFGDRTAPSAWIKNSLRIVDQERFDVVGGDNFQRPFELATVRLQNMMDVLSNWEALVPADTRLITQMGGAYILRKSGRSSCETVYEFKDSGILNYVDLAQALSTIDVQLVD